MTAPRPYGNVPVVVNAFLDAATVRPVGGGRYLAELDERWNLRPLPQGGIITAIAVRAMEAELAHEHQRPRTLHTTFAAQVTHGPLDVEVEVLRAGRSMSQLRAEIRNPGSRRGHLTTCVFGASRRGFDFTDLGPPDVIPDPAVCPSFRDPPPEGEPAFDPMPFWAQLVEGRSVIGHAPWDDHVPERAERAMWYRFDESPLLADGRLDPLALIVLADTMPGAVGEMVGRSRQTWFAPSVDLTVHLLDNCRSSWVLAHNRARFAGDGYASADMALWDCGDDGGGAPRLVAYATQMFLFTFSS
ncbi:MAG TPA: thioesterase family protein [Acidimicrobiales bacterium]|nr:thioesterase family protein [Acidimicrobiales bacterium]